MNPSHTGAARYCATSADTTNGTSSMPAPTATERAARAEWAGLGGRAGLAGRAGWAGGAGWTFVVRTFRSATSPIDPPEWLPLHTLTRSAPSKIAGQIVANDH